jgi:hypothetical protein
VAGSVEAKIRGQVMGILEELRKAEPITRDRVREILDQVCAIYPALPGDLDRDLMVATIEEKISIWIGDAQELVNNEDHIPWLTERKPEIEWSYWDRYRTHMLPKIGLDPITKLDEITDRILSHLEDPAREGPWDRRGLVVGHVQSGKTSNYTGLICKAADAGYKIIIVLAGLHKNLRSQTQIRLEEGFLGYNNDRTQEEGYIPVGVGLVDPSNRLRPDSVTNRADNGDFNRNRASTFAINPGGRPLLFVIKKQKSVLQNLIDWVRWARTNVDLETGRTTVSGIPLLLVDDEADHASVDTKDGAFDENGDPDPEHDPSTINRLIRTLLTLFQQKAYVGYTATPFANIFIHEKGQTEEEGPDLFPSSFIVSLPAPSDYFGPAHVFGVAEENDDESPAQHRYVREIEDHADSLEPNEKFGWVPPKHRNGHAPRYHGERVIPPSLRRAIHSFVIATAIRRARGQLKEHNSMLVHVSRFTSVQNQVKEEIEAEVHALKRELRYGEVDGNRSALAELQDLFESDFAPSQSEAYNVDDTPFVWEDIEPEVRTAAAILQIKEINGTAGDILDYEQERDTGLAVIAVGGDKLSRGLTLEGLTVSYFLRASRMYDTLMQMGRWFGYRRGYEDVCRLFMTADLREWFENITVAAEELRQEFDHMAAIRGTPRNYGLRVRSHPTLMVTSQVKMRSGTRMKLSFAGTISETIVFHRSQEVIARNYEAAENLLLALGAPTETNPERERPGTKHRWKGACVWEAASPSDILAFLSAYVTHEDSVKANSNYLRQFIEKQVAIGDLTSWDVVLLSGRGQKRDIARLEVNLIQRNPLERNLSIAAQKDAGKYIIGRLVSPRDEAIDLDSQAWQDALHLAQAAWQRDFARNPHDGELPDEPSGTSIRQVRDQKRGLLMLYPLDPDNDVTRHQELPVMAFAISFPTSENATEIDYVVNNVFVSSDAEL